MNAHAKPQRFALRLATLVAAMLLVGVAAQQAAAATKVGIVARPKGQEPHHLQAMGLVFGLDGTGDGASFAPTQRALALAMQVSGMPIGDVSKELKDAKNVALVMVQVTIPAEGARQGEQLDAKVSAIAGKSLKGGRLFLTPLLGPVPDTDPIVFGVAQGAITLDDPEVPTTGTVFAGCKVEEDFVNPFVREGKITLVLKPQFAEFQMAQAVAYAVNRAMEAEAAGAEIAKALDPVNVVVDVPDAYGEYPAQFASQLLEVEIFDQKTGPRVTINERAGAIAVSENVEIGPIAVSHKNIIIQAGMEPTNGFVPVDPANPENVKLQALVNALNAVNVPSADKIAIIKQIDKNGKLYGELIIE